MNNIYRIIEKEHGKRKNELLRKYSNAEKHFAKHSTGIQYKYLINATNSDDIHKSNMFIISINMDKLKGLINEYYEYLWNK